MLPGVVRRVTIRRYLLGGLSVRERERLEERYFRNDELFEEIEKVEDELVDAYVRGHLPQSESRLFEENYLTSERRRHRVGVARELLSMRRMQSWQVRSRRSGSGWADSGSDSWCFLQAFFWPWLSWVGDSLQRLTTVISRVVSPHRNRICPKPRRRQ